MSRWISVDDSMPKACQDVFIWPRPDFGVEQFVGHFNPHATGKAYESTGFAGWFAAEYESSYGISLRHVNVTHWMPLPEPPECKQ